MRLGTMKTKAVASMYGAFKHQRFDIGQTVSIVEENQYGNFIVESLDRTMKGFVFSHEVNLVKSFYYIHGYNFCFQKVGEKGMTAFLHILDKNGNFIAETTQMSRDLKRGSGSPYGENEVFISFSELKAAYPQLETPKGGYPSDLRSA